MTITQDDNGAKGRFFIGDPQAPDGVMTYVWAGSGSFIIDHTEVGERLSGQGAGKQLVMAAVAFARTRHVTILPLCPFARSVFDRVPEIADVLAT
jgi:predicted GNAT family acetyltransferase